MSGALVHWAAIVTSSEMLQSCAVETLLLYCSDLGSNIYIYLVWNKRQGNRANLRPRKWRIFATVFLSSGKELLWVAFVVWLLEKNGETDFGNVQNEDDWTGAYCATALVFYKVRISISESKCAEFSQRLPDFSWFSWSSFVMMDNCAVKKKAF